MTALVKTTSTSENRYIPSLLILTWDHESLEDVINRVREICQRE